VSTTTKSDFVWFTTKGQVVIPAWLRKQFHIEDGTKAIVQATPEGILLKPVTKWAIDRGFGLLKCRPGGKPFAEEWAEHKREELELEETPFHQPRPGRSRRRVQSAFQDQPGRRLRRRAGEGK
jgi:AbrB family looped-hinge helix DNA binding protein